MASSSTSQSLTSKNQQNESNQTSETIDQNASKTVSPHAVSRRRLCRSVLTSPIQSHFFAQSGVALHHQSSEPRLHARPFDEFAIGPQNPDGQSGSDTKSNDNQSSQSNKKS